MNFLYIIFIFVVQNGLITKVLALSQTLPFNSPNGNCSTIVSYLETYQVPYLETYKQRTWGIFYKTRYRWNYKIESHRVLRREYRCCHGYSLKQMGPREMCEPICESDCKNGVCKYPNKCICNDGYRSEKVNALPWEHSDCVPVCTQSCVDGKCVAPETCKCDSGYKLMNDDRYTCEPVCNVPCGNGSYCYKPDECLCLNGYKMINSELPTCQPICQGECVHGKCTAPNTCTCDPGYELDSFDLFVCEPKCEPNCIYSSCTAPNVCTCSAGYSLKNTSHICEPICSKACVMGTCVAPETCSCFMGYGLHENSKYICEPVCEKACFNGKCTEPGVCTCNKGFELSGDETEKHICKPRCEISCEPFGVCTAPDVCKCFEGYRLAEKTRVKRNISIHFADNSVCEPVCDLACINGFCSAPSICSCNVGYYPSGSNSTSFWCKPVCSQNCVNGFCSAPETCTCNEGYHDPSNSSSVCKPFCETDCVNGYCTAPNECTCKSGYQLVKANQTSLCEPICNPNCENGICVQPDICSCNPGYHPSTNSKINACDPICHPACGTNGICKAPNFCVCKDGYRKIYYGKDVPFGCEPICSVECGNGTCTAPDLCACFDGYRNAETGGCEPVCTTCGNGTCVAPEVCECDDGFVLANLGFGEQESRFSIVPENKTENGSRCIPHCKNCDNGECEAPDECRCHVGFVKIEDTCKHACQGGCGPHGECITERRTCECNYGWAGPHCDQPTLCVLNFSNEVSYTKQLTIIEEQNATIKHILMNIPACFECIGKVNNETLCFKMLINGTTNETQIGCIINKDCFSSSSQYKDQGKIINGIVGGILLLTAITIYLIIRKHRNSQMNLDSVQTTWKNSTSMQGLIEPNTDNS